MTGGSGRAIVVAGVLGFILGGGLVGWLTRAREREQVRFTVAPRASLGGASPGGIEEAVRRAGRAVVQIETTLGGRALPRGLREMLPVPEGELIPEGQASGVIINGERGYIITNAHVVRGASRISVTLADGRRFPARTVGTDPFSDLAVLKIDAKGLPALVLGSSENLPIGSWLVAIGNPFRFENSVTVGVLSAKRRDLPAPGRDLPLEDLIQTDAAINRGNSGGAVVNLEGELVGIPTAIVSPRVGQGMGFAVCVERVRRVVPQLIARGRATWAWLGIEYAPVGMEEVPKERPPTATGMIVTDVVRAGPAHRAGVKGGDIIASVDGRALRLKSDLQLYVRSRDPGSAVNLRTWREGRWLNIRVVIEPIPEAAVR